LSALRNKNQSDSEQLAVNECLAHTAYAQ